MQANIRRTVILGGGLAALAALALFSVGPPPSGSEDPRALAGPETGFVELLDLDVRVDRAGSGEPSFVLLHGFGASSFTWHAVAASLAERGSTLAFDRPAFGLTERPLALDDGARDPYTLVFAQALLQALLDASGVERAILVGNSAGGTVALEFALAHPERVRALVLISPAVFRAGPPAFVRSLLSLPGMSSAGPFLLRQLLPRFGDRGIEAAWHDPSRITPEILAGYRLPLQVKGWDRALWAFTLASAPSDLAERVALLRVPTLIVTGDDDRIVPTEESVKLAGAIPGAALAVIPACGHLAHEECPAELLAALDPFLASLAVGR